VCIVLNSIVLTRSQLKLYKAEDPAVAVRVL
jgi:hypothetical protein